MPIESAIISDYGEVLEIDIENLSFKDCTLAIDTPKYKKGDRVEVVAFDFEESEVKIFDKEEDEEPSEVLDIKLVLA